MILHWSLQRSKGSRKGPLCVITLRFSMKWVRSIDAGVKCLNHFRELEKLLVSGNKWCLREWTDAGEGVDGVRELSFRAVIISRVPFFSLWARGSWHQNRPWLKLEAGKADKEDGGLRGETIMRVQRRRGIRSFKRWKMKRSEEGEPKFTYVLVWMNTIELIALFSCNRLWKKSGFCNVNMLILRG